MANTTTTPTPKPKLKQKKNSVKVINRPTQGQSQFFTSTPMCDPDIGLYVFVRENKVTGVSLFQPSNLLQGKDIRCIKVSLSDYKRKLEGVDYGSWTNLCQFGAEYSK